MTRLILVPLVCLSFNAQARWLTKPESGSVIELFNIDNDVRADGASTMSIEYALRIQAEDAKANASKLNIDYNSATDSVEVLEAYTLNGKTKIPVPADGIEDRDNGESKDFDAMKVRSIVFPQVQIGSRLYVRYRTTTAKPIVRDRWSDHFALFPTMVMEKLRYRVTSARPLFVESSDPGGYLRVTQKDPRHVELTLKRELPGGVQAEKDPYWHPARAAEAWITTEREWPAFFEGLNAEFQKVVSAPLPTAFAGWVKSARKLKTPEDRAFYLMRQMSENLRYFGDWRRHDGGLIPRTLDEVERSRYGDCKDLSSALTAMLRELGLDAHPALIRRGDNPYGHEPDFGLPAIGRFNHVITRVDLKNGRTWWLDATNPVASLDAIADVSGRPTLVLEPKAPRLDRTPDARPNEYLQTADYVYRFTEGQGVKVSVDASFRGLGASRLANSLLLSSRANVLSDLLEYVGENEEIKSHRFTREPTTSRRLADVAMSLDFDADRVTYTAGASAFFVMSDSFLNGTFYETADRESDLRLSETPYASRLSRRLKNTRLAQEAPAPCLIDSPWFHAERRVVTEGPDVVITQAVELRKAYLTRADMRSPEFVAAQRAARGCFSRAGVLIAVRP